MAGISVGSTTTASSPQYSGPGSSPSTGGYPSASGDSTSSTSTIDNASIEASNSPYSGMPSGSNTSSQSGIGAISQQPTTIDLLRDSPTTTDILAQQSSDDDQGPIAAIAGAAAQDVAGRTAPASSTTYSRNTIDAAAFDGLEQANPRSIADNLEYGGLIYQNSDTGKFSATEPVRGTPDGVNPFDATVPAGADIVGDYHTHGDYSAAESDGSARRTTNPLSDGYNSNNFSDFDLEAITNDASGIKGYTGFLGTPGSDYRRFDPATQTDSVMSIPGESARGTARGGALTGAAVELGTSTYNALRDGFDPSTDINTIASTSAQGALAGGAQAAGEHYAERAIDRAIGSTVQRNATAVAAARNVVDDVAIGTAARTVVSRVGGAGLVGAAVGTGFSIYENRAGLAAGDSEAIGDVAGDTVVAAGSAVAGAAAGAAIGSIVPVVGTAVGAVVGLGVGLGADYIMRRGGVDEIIGDAVSSTVDTAKDAGRKVASFFGF